MRSPSGLHAIRVTASIWPAKTRGSPDPSVFHTRAILLSEEPVMMRSLSGLHTAASTRTTSRQAAESEAEGAEGQRREQPEQVASIGRGRLEGRQREGRAPVSP